MQWVGSSLVVSSFANVQSKFGPQPIYEISVSGSTGVVSGPVLLHSPHDKNPYQPVQFWLQGDTMIGPDRVAKDRNFKLYGNRRARPEDRSSSLTLGLTGVAGRSRWVAMDYVEGLKIPKEY